MTETSDDRLLDIMVEECRAVTNVYTISTHMKLKAYAELLAGTFRVCCIRGEKTEVLGLVDQLYCELKTVVEESYHDR